jgi:alpha-glucosidase (family GH31 glycosyl hydrolase)
MYPWYDKTPLSERRNKYIYLLSKTVDKLLRDVYQDDQVNFARAAFHRCQPYLTAVWGGDSRSTWDGLAGNLANAMRCSFMGFPIWGSDVGGYLSGRIPENLYARWLQFGVWSSLNEIKIDDAGGKREDRPPWKYSERLQNIFRSCNNLRMELQPFIYSLANTSYKNGVVMKPLAYVYPEDTRTYNMWDEFMVGNTFLVAPILDSTDSRTVYLPQGTWFDYYDVNKTFEGNKEIVAMQPLERIPVLIKSNSIYVTGKMISGNSKLWDTDSKELTIYAYPGKNGENVSFDYVDFLNGNKEKLFLVKSELKSIEFSATSLSITTALIVKLDKKPSDVTLNGKKVNYDWDKKQNKAKIQLIKNVENNITIAR